MAGLHHVTAIVGNTSPNIDFYTRTPSFRLVKKTVNSDDPGTWHFYYGDCGRPLPLPPAPHPDPEEGEGVRCGK